MVIAEYQPEILVYDIEDEVIVTWKIQRKLANIARSSNKSLAKKKIWIYKITFLDLKITRSPEQSTEQTLRYLTGI